MKSKFDIVYPSGDNKYPFAIARIHLKKRNDDKYVVKVYSVDTNGEKCLLEVNVCNDATDIRNSIICILRKNKPILPIISSSLDKFNNPYYATRKVRYTCPENLPLLLQVRGRELFRTFVKFGEVVQVRLIDLSHDTFNVRNDANKNIEIYTVLKNAIMRLYITADVRGWRDFTFCHRIVLGNNDRGVVFRPLTCRFSGVSSTTQKLEIYNFESEDPTDIKLHAYMLYDGIKDGNDAAKKIVEQIEYHAREHQWEMTEENLLNNIRGIVNRMEKD